MIKEQFKHDRDERITRHADFDKNHIYLLDGKADHNYTSVTSFVREFFPQFNADKVIEKSYDKWQKFKHPKYYGKSKDQIKKEWKSNGQFKSQLGTEIHDLIETYYKTGKVPKYSIEWLYFDKFVEDYKHFTPVASEYMVFHEDYKLIGTLDMVFKDGDDYIIVDWKRKLKDKYNINKVFDYGKPPISHIPKNSFYEDCLQLNIYKRILEDKYGVKIKDMYLCLLHPKNDNYELVKVIDLSLEVDNMLKHLLTP